MTTDAVVAGPPSPRLYDLVAILYRPRETMRRILDASRDRWGIQIIVLAFVCGSANDADLHRVPDVLPGLTTLSLVSIAAIGLIAGAATWVAFLFVMSWIAAAVGRMLGGTAAVADVRAALAWSMVPVIWSVLYRVPLYFLALHFHVVQKSNVHDTLLEFAAQGGCSVIAVFFTLQILFALWCVGLASCTLAEAQRFPIGKGIINAVMTIGVPVAVGVSAYLVWAH